MLHFEILKQKPGELFDDIELISDPCHDKDEQLQGYFIHASQIINDEKEPEIDIDWHKVTASRSCPKGYGFMNAYNGMFVGVNQMPRLNEMFKYHKDIEDLESTQDQNAVYRIFEDFDEDEFIADSLAVDDAMYAECREHWHELWWSSTANDSANELSSEFKKLAIDNNNDDDGSLLADITFKRLETASIDIKEHLLCLSSLIYAYCHTMRTFAGDISSDATCGIAEMTPVLSSLYRPHTISQLVDMHLRCAISKPLFRKLELHELALQDVSDILLQGRKAILKLLKHMYDLFESDSYEDMWRFNEIWIKDMMHWIHMSKWIDNASILQELAREISNYETDYATCEINGWTMAELQEIIADARE